jgi:hypothetical protein
VGARDGRTQSARACLFFFCFTPNPLLLFFNKFLILILVVNFEFHPVCLSFFPEHRLCCYIYFHCLPVTTAIISLEPCVVNASFSLSRSGPGSQDLGFKTCWAASAIERLTSPRHSPILPRNVAGRFCHGTSSDARTQQVTLYIWLELRAAAGAHHCI